MLSNSFLITPQELNKIIDNPQLVVLDACNEIKEEETYIPKTQAFNIKHDFSDTTSALPNALLSPEVFESKCRALGINNDSTIVVYDHKGIFFSPRVWWMFKTMGLSNIAVLDGGFDGWVKAGFSTISNVIKNSSVGDFLESFDRSKVRFFDDVFGNIESQNELVVDVRSKGRFNSEIQESRVGLRSGQIPQSINIPYTDLLSNGFMKDDDALKSILKVVLNEQRPIVFSCGSGITACVVHLALSKVSDKYSVIYDGSWTEWGTLVQ